MADSKKTITRGDDNPYNLTIYDGEGADREAVDLSGATIWYTLKDSFADLDTAAHVQLQSPDDITIAPDQVANTGEVYIDLTSAHTQDLPLGTLKFDVQVKTSAGRVKTVVKGEVEIEGDVTRAVS